jgi:dCMP deaminase
MYSTKNDRVGFQEPQPKKRKIRDPDKIGNPLRSTYGMTGSGMQYSIAFPRLKELPPTSSSNMDSFNLSFEETAMAMAIVTSMRSKDTITKVGVVITDKNNIIRGTGYNGMSRGCDETESMWSKEKKNDSVIHAEVNGLLNYHGPKALTDPDNYLCMYTTLFPCIDCAKKITNTSIKNIIFQHKKPHKEAENQKVYELLSRCGIALVEYSTLKHQQEESE